MIFVSFCQQDRPALERLRRFIDPLEREGLLDLWDESRLRGGDDRRQEIQRAIETSAVAVLLISQDYLASDELVEFELPLLLLQAEKKSLILIPVFLSPSLVEDLEITFEDSESATCLRKRLTAFQGFGSPRETLAQQSWSESEKTLRNLARRLIELTGTLVIPDDLSPSGSAHQEAASERNSSRSVQVHGSVSNSPIVTGDHVTLQIFNGAKDQTTERPSFQDDTSRRLAEELEHLFEQRKEMERTGQDSKAVQIQILEVSRELRKGPQLRPGEFLKDGRFQLLREVGQGGIAKVWKAWDDHRKKPVAIKVLHGHLCQDRSTRERFFRGSRKMAAASHAHVVRVLDDQGDH